MTAPDFLKIDKIIFKDGKTLTNCIGALAEGFLIVAKDEEDEAPIWYSTATITRLEGVKINHPRQPQKVRLFT